MAPLVIVCRLIKAAVKQATTATRPIRRYRHIRRLGKVAAAAKSKTAIVGWLCIATGGGFWVVGEFVAPIRITPEMGVTNRGGVEIQLTPQLNALPGNSGLIEVSGEFSVLPPDILAGPVPAVEILLSQPGELAFAPVPDCCSPAPQPAPEAPPEQPTPVPEPASLALLATAVAAGLWKGRPK